MAQIWRTIKRKISVTCCFATRYADFGGERGIRTPGTSQFNGFQDRRDRPLRHLSSVIWRLCYRLTGAKLGIFI